MVTLVKTSQNPDCLLWPCPLLQKAIWVGFLDLTAIGCFLTVTWNNIYNFNYSVWACWFSTLHAKLCMTNVRIKIGFFCLRCVCCVCKSFGYYVSQTMQISGSPLSLRLHNYANWIKMYYILTCGDASLCLSCVLFVSQDTGI